MEYAVRESFGQQKWELLVDRVEAAQESQEEAKAQFVSALEQFKALTGFDGGDLERTYTTLKRELEISEDRARDVRKRIAAVEDVAEALFAEWERELGEYYSEEKRRSSERSLRATRQAYERLAGLMHSAEQRMEPVLRAFRDQVLYLKHMLNARAVASLEGVSGDLEREVDVLIAEMERAIAEAARFVEAMRLAESGR